MTATIIDGQLIAEQIRGELRERIARLKERGITPGLAVVLVGDDPASVVYVRNKGKAAQALGIDSETFHRPAETTQGELDELIAGLNADPRWHGILVQIPLPKPLDENRAANAVDPAKDVDGLNPVTAGRLYRGEPGFLPCTPAGIQQLLLRYGHNPEGKRVVICGRSNLVGKPLAGILMQKAPGANATVTICHTRTRDLGEITRQADVLVAAMGQRNAITADMVRDGAVVIDVGTNRVDDPTKKSGYRLAGDVDFEAVAQKAAAISPVPGGVGPMTITMLLSNTVLAAEGGAGGRAD